MADHTHIEWTEATWNPITGCSLASPGCTNCYAMKLAGTRLRDHPSRAGLTTGSKAGPVWTGEVRFNEQWLDQPLRWRRPRMIFVCAHGDLFHESVPDAWIDRVFAVMALCPQHTFQVLTKRAGRMREYMTSRDEGPLPVSALQRIQDAAYYLASRRSGGWDEAAGMAARQAVVDNLLRVDARTNAGFKNVWLGVSVEDQARADERIPHLLATPAAVRWISAEPLLGPVDLCRVQGTLAAIAGYIPIESTDQKPVGLDWVVCGGESGAGARPMYPDWARSLRDQCAAAGVPYFLKQWGEYFPCELLPDHGDNTPWRTHWDGQPVWMLSEYGRDRAELDPVIMTKIGKKRAGRLLDGQLHDAMPQVRA